jgi:hypothetical protein
MSRGLCRNPRSAATNTYAHTSATQLACVRDRCHVIAMDEEWDSYPLHEVWFSAVPSHERCLTSGIRVSDRLGRRLAAGDQLLER